MTSLPPGLERHPWNTGFEWPVLPEPARFLGPELVRRFGRDGFLHLPAVFDPGIIDEVREETDALQRRREQELRSVGGRQGISERGAITFAAKLVVESPVLRRFVERPELAELCADLLGPDVNLYWEQAVYKQPERPRRFPWHQDNGYTFVEPPHYLTCWLPLVEVTSENGCPEVVPGAHLFGTLAHRYVDPLGWECFSEPPKPPVVVPASPGDVVAFSSLTPHLTGPNRTPEVRKAYIVQFARAGASVLTGDPASGPPSGRRPCDDAASQFPLLRSGRRVTGG